MDEEISKLLKYLNTNYKEKHTVPDLCKKGFELRIINFAKELGLIDILPYVNTRRDGVTEDARVCKLTKEGLLYVDNLKNRKDPISIHNQGVMLNSPVIAGSHEKNDVNINYGHQNIIKKSTAYKGKKEDVALYETFSPVLIEKIGEKKMSIMGVVSLIIGIIQLMIWGNSITPAKLFSYLPQLAANLSKWVFGAGVIFILIGAFFVGNIVYYRKTKCEKCERLFAYYESQNPDVEEVKAHDGTHVTTTRKYACKYCGHTKTDEHTEVIDNRKK